MTDDHVPPELSVVTQDGADLAALGAQLATTAEHLASRSWHPSETLENSPIRVTVLGLLGMVVATLRAESRVEAIDVGSESVLDALVLLAGSDDMPTFAELMAAAAEEIAAHAADEFSTEIGRLEGSADD